MTQDLILMNLGYAAMFVAMYVASQIKLRSLLIFYQAVTIWRAYVYLDNLNMFIWHALFLILNAYRLYELYLESRQVTVPEALKDVKVLAFNTMTPREFFYLWDIGREIKYGAKQRLLQKEQKNDRLILILEGAVDIQVQKGLTIAQNRRGDFVGEMSLITNNPVSATVIADDAVLCREWTLSDLKGLQKKHNEVYQKLLGEFGRDIVDKLIAANERLANHIPATSQDVIATSRTSDVKQDDEANARSSDGRAVTLDEIEALREKAN
jgi:CRP-like cAMP-binding protein